MIRNKKELGFYIQADYMMNRGYFKPSIKQRIKNVIAPDFIMRFLTTMRKVDYYTNCRHNSVLVKIALIYNKIVEIL